MVGRTSGDFVVCLAPPATRLALDQVGAPPASMISNPYRPTTRVALQRAASSQQVPVRSAASMFSQRGATQAVILVECLSGFHRDQHAMRLQAVWMLVVVKTKVQASIFADWLAAIGGSPPFPLPGRQLDGWHACHYNAEIAIGLGLVQERIRCPRRPPVPARAKRSIG